MAGVDCIICRTGYTGEDGFELYCPPKDAEKLWFALLEAGQGRRRRSRAASARATRCAPR